MTSKAITVFDNPGEIDPIVIRTFGVSVKESANPIGFFGTGLKYALAILMREHHEVLIQCGAETHTIGVVERTIRGESFKIITMDGEPLPFVDQVGKTWQLWMAYRELYCNCIDEKGRVYSANAVPTPEAGRTRIVVIGDQFREQHERRSSFILEGEPIYKLEGSEVYPGESRGLFYRGMLIHRFKEGQISRYTYNFTRRVDLTEDRTAKYSFLLPGYLAQDILSAETDDLLKDLLALPNRYFEAHVDFRNEGKPSPVFLRTVATLSLDKRAKLNSSAAQVYKQEVRTKLAPSPVRLRGVENELLERAVNFARSLGFDVLQYPITVTDTLGDAGNLGMAEDGHIYIAKRCFMLGTKTVAATLIEEFVHLKFGFEDESREMQNFLFEKLVSIGEELGGRPL